MLKIQLRFKESAHAGGVVWGREEHRRGGGRASPRSTRSLPDDAYCDRTSSGGCVVGRCWGVCPSWVPVSLVGLSSWLAG